MKKRFLLLAGLLLGGMAVKADLIYDFSKPEKRINTTSVPGLIG